jgi:hypothetical protein
MNKKILTSIFALIAIIGLAFTAPAQTTVNPSGGTTTVSNPAPAPPAWYTGFTNIFYNVTQSTQLVYAPFGTVLTSGEKKGTAGGGIVAAYNWTQYFGTGVGIYYLGGWSMFNGQAQLMLPIPITANFKIQPFTVGGLGTSLSGAGSANGDLTVITQLGMAASVVHLGSWSLDAGGFWGTITGAGPYSGRNVGGTLAFSRGF